MGNLLTPALLAAAMTAVINLAMGADAISWNVFIAALVSFMLSLDSGDSRIAEGSPLGRSAGGALAITYATGVLAYALIVLAGLARADAAMLVLAVATGAAARLLAEAATGKAVYTMPRKLDPLTWLEETSPESDRFWSGWGRIPAGRRLGDVHVNALSAALILASIWLGGMGG